MYTEYSIWAKTFKLAEVYPLAEISWLFMLSGDSLFPGFCSQEFKSGKGMNCQAKLYHETQSLQGPFYRLNTTHIVPELQMS